MTQYVLDCTLSSTTTHNDISCSMIPYTAPPATVDHYAVGPTWGLWVAAGIILAFIIATAVVRYRVHTERGETERYRIMHPPEQCPTCGYKLETS